MRSSLFPNGSAAMAVIAIFMLACLSHPLRAQSTPRPARRPADVATGELGMVVSDAPLASRVGQQVLTRGGNAVDAAVATAFALAVVWPEAGNIGGGGFMMVAPPRGAVTCIDYRETAPQSVRQDSFVDWNQRHHARMAGVPGTIHGLATAHKKYGYLQWQSLVEPSIRLARDGIEVNEHLASSLNAVLKLSAIKKEPRHAEFRRVFGPPRDSGWKKGDHLVQPDLARTLTHIARSGPKVFYDGAIAMAIANEMELRSGLITRSDLQQYRAKIRTPESGMFNGFTIYGAPPPSSGGMTVIMQLRMIEALELKRDPSEFWNADQVHLMTEVMRRAFRERAAWLGDPDFVSVNDLVRSRASAEQLAQTIEVDSATSSQSIAGSIPLTDGPFESLETTHFSIIDAQGMAVSNTYTLEGPFGCRIIPKDTGFVLNNEMGDFNWQPGYTNLQGRIGTKPNQIAPGKRMLSSQSPTIVKQGDQVKLVVGSPGGRTIINTVTELLVQVLLFERDALQAVEGPRFHHQWLPDVLRMESDSNDTCLTRVAAELERRGHRLEFPDHWRQGSAQLIDVDLVTGMAIGVADWRRGASAMAVTEAVQYSPRSASSGLQSRASRGSGASP
ncbi:MAG: gamma-glutamyltransferase [Planctomycetota bacterium]